MYGIHKKWVQSNLLFILLHVVFTRPLLGAHWATCWIVAFTKRQIAVVRSARWRSQSLQTMGVMNSGLHQLCAACRVSAQLGCLSEVLPSLLLSLRVFLPTSPILLAFVWCVSLALFSNGTIGGWNAQLDLFTLTVSRPTRVWSAPSAFGGRSRAPST